MTNDKEALHNLKNVYTLFCEATPIHGIQYMVNKDLSKTERWCWVLIIITFISCLIYSCTSMYLGFIDNPTVTTLEETHYSISNIDLPGIAICSNNKISKVRIEAFVEELSLKFNKSRKWVSRQVLWLGNFYDNRLQSDDQRVEFQNILDDLFKDQSNTWVDMRHLLDELSVQCDELLVDCYWMGEKRNCQSLFQRDLTSDGHCCIFNLTKSQIKSRIKYDTNDFNIDTGLKVLINNLPDDYYYSTLMFEGIDVKIFKQNNYPDSSTSGVIDVFVGMGNEALLSVEASLTKASDNIRDFSIPARKCVFENEDESGSSLTECILKCKIETIKSLCNCVPFMIPYSQSHVLCNTMDISCLNKYNEKLNTLAPSDDVSEAMHLEKENSMKCKCYPACTYTEYSVYANYAPLILHGNITQEKTHSFIHIYYGKSHINLFSVNVAMFWYDLVCNIGGLGGLLLGVSVISVIELIYYFLTYLFYIFCHVIGKK